MLSNAQQISWPFKNTHFQRLGRVDLMFLLLALAWQLCEKVVATPLLQVSVSWWQSVVSILSQQVLFGHHICLKVLGYNDKKPLCKCQVLLTQRNFLLPVHTFFLSNTRLFTRLDILDRWFFLDWHNSIHVEIENISGRQSIELPKILALQLVISIVPIEYWIIMPFPWTKHFLLSKKLRKLLFTLYICHAP